MKGRNGEKANCLLHKHKDPSSIPSTHVEPSEHPHALTSTHLYPLTLLHRIHKRKHLPFKNLNRTGSKGRVKRKSWSTKYGL